MGGKSPHFTMGREVGEWRREKSALSMLVWSCAWQFCSAVLVEQKLEKHHGTQRQASSDSQTNTDLTYRQIGRHDLPSLHSRPTGKTKKHPDPLQPSNKGEMGSRVGGSKVRIYRGSHERRLSCPSALCVAGLERSMQSELILSSPALISAF